MTSFQVNLTNCDIEPIHIPGQIQSHGFLLVLDNKNIIRYCSENIPKFFDKNPDNFLGKPLEYLEALLENKQQPDLITQLIALGKGKGTFAQTNPYELNILNA